MHSKLIENYLEALYGVRHLSMPWALSSITYNQDLAALQNSALEQYLEESIIHRSAEKKMAVQGLNLRPLRGTRNQNLDSKEFTSRHFNTSKTAVFRGLRAD